MISIVTINFNNLSGLKRTVESVLSQTFKSIEYILIDGGSTDGGAAYVAELSAELAYAVSEPDEGIFDAQNKGLSKATGDYVLVLNSGDELADRNVLSDIFCQPQDSDIVYGNMYIIENNGVKTEGYMPQDINAEHMLRDTLWHPVSFVRRDFLRQVGFYDTSYSVVADYQWFLRAIFQHKAVLKHTNRFVAKFYLDGLSSDVANAGRIASERRRAQQGVFSQETIDAYDRKVAKAPSLWKQMMRRLGVKRQIFRT